MPATGMTGSERPAEVAGEAQADAVVAADDLHPEVRGELVVDLRVDAETAEERVVCAATASSGGLGRRRP